MGMNKKLLAASLFLDKARQMLADYPRSNKALVALIVAEENYLLERALARALARVG